MSLPLGLTLPLMELERLFILKDQPSLIDIVTGLFQAGDGILGLVVFIASIALPIIKIGALSISLARGTIGNGRTHKLIGFFSKWSMLDVMLVAIAIFAAKTSGLATAISQPGLWFFTYSALASAVAAHLIGRLEADPQTD